MVQDSRPTKVAGYDSYDVDQIHELTIARLARLARRIIHGQAARQDGSPRYLEHGQLTD